MLRCRRRGTARCDGVEAGSAAADDARGTQRDDLGHEVGALGCGGEDDGATEGEADADRGTADLLEEGDQIVAQLGERAFGGTDGGASVPAEVVGVGGHRQAGLLDGAPAAVILGEAVDQHHRGALTGAGVGHVDVAERDALRREFDGAAGHIFS